MSRRMPGKSKLDYLVNAEVERQAIYGGCCYKFSAVLSSLLGIVVLLSSFFVLSHERLQIQNYLEPQPRFYYEVFPSLYLGCSAATTAASILQTVGALMLIFEDVTLNAWKWLNFTVLMISSAVVMLLITDHTKYGEIASFTAYFVVTIINLIFCMLILAGDICCTRAKKKKNEPMPY